jgi:hypothetical protein
MAAQAHDTVSPATASSPATVSRRRRADAGALHLSQRDIDGLLLCGEHSGAPFDLLAAALRVEPERLSAITARWRRAGFAATARLGPGPKWCWLTRDGMTATGLGFTAGPPALGRLAHLRAILAARLWMEASPAWRDGRPWWHEATAARRTAAADRAGHHGVHWPASTAVPTPGRSGLEWSSARRPGGPRGSIRAAVADAVCPGLCGRATRPVVNPGGRATAARGGQVVVRPARLRVPWWGHGGGGPIRGPPGGRRADCVIHVPSSGPCRQMGFQRAETSKPAAR